MREGDTVMKHRRPIAQINLEIETALAYKDRYVTRPTSDPLVAEMRAANEAEIEALQHELEEALADLAEGGGTSP